MVLVGKQWPKNHWEAHNISKNVFILFEKNKTKIRQQKTLFCVFNYSKCFYCNRYTFNGFLLCVEVTLSTVIHHKEFLFEVRENFAHTQLRILFSCSSHNLSICRSNNIFALLRLLWNKLFSQLINLSWIYYKYWKTIGIT